MKEKIRVFKNINEGTTGLRSEFFLPKSTASMYHCQRHNGPISGWVLLLRIILNRSFTGVKIFYQVPYSPLAGGNITFWGHVYSALLASTGTFSRLFCLGADCLRFTGLIQGWSSIYQFIFVDLFVSMRLLFISNELQKANLHFVHVVKYLVTPRPHSSQML